MPDRRPIDQVPTEELERILAIRKRKERAQRVRRLAVLGRIAQAELPAQEPAAEGQTPVLEVTGRPMGRYRAIEAGDEEELPKEKPGRHSIAWGWLFNKFLLFIEIGAVVGLILVLASSFLSLRELNQSVKDVLTPSPTETPRPLIDAVVLPSGHRPPTAPGVVEPNLDEIPEHLRMLVQAVTPLPIPTQGPEQPSRIIIKSISVDAPLGRAVIGGLLAATFTTLFFVPVVYAAIHEALDRRQAKHAQRGHGSDALPAMGTD